ncbi:hypothetical protein WG66_012854, partial [Moniliophthora roreri]
ETCNTVPRRLVNFIALRQLELTDEAVNVSSPAENVLQTWEVGHRARGSSSRRLVLHPHHSSSVGFHHIQIDSTSTRLLGFIALAKI